MGDIADGMLDGTFDSETGEYLGPPCGYPRTARDMHGARETKRDRAEAVTANWQAARDFAASAGLTLRKCSGVHYQLRRDGDTPFILNIYPTKRRIWRDKKAGYFPFVDGLPGDWTISDLVRRTVEIIKSGKDKP